MQLSYTPKGRLMMQVVDRKSLNKLVQAALFLNLALVLPFFTMNVPAVGARLLPLHLPILICGIVVGWKHGAIVGLIAPLLRSFMIGTPPLFPTAVAMTFELAVYGAIIGLLYARLPKNIVGLYISLIGAMLAGRVVWAAVRVIISGVSDNVFTWQMFVAGGFTNALPGIIFQLIFIPTLIVTLHKAGIIQPKAASHA